MGWKFWKWYISLKRDHTPKFESRLLTVRCFWPIREYSCNCSCVLFVCQISSLSHGYKNHGKYEIMWNPKIWTCAWMLVCSWITQAKHLLPAVMFWHLGITSLFWTNKRKCTFWLNNLCQCIHAEKTTNQLLMPTPKKKKKKKAVLFILFM